MPELNRKRFLALGLFSLITLLLAGLWRMLGILIYPVSEPFPPALRPHAKTEPATPVRKPETGRFADTDESDKASRAKDPQNEGSSHNANGADAPNDGETARNWQRPLGKTGIMVSIFGLGGGGIIARSEHKDEAIELITRALDMGVNYIDTAPTYGGATSELNIGKAIKNRRKEVFLATKTLDRTYDGTMRLLEQSLKRLQTDRVDLYQIHGLRDQEDGASIFERGGVLEAMQKLKSEGVVRYLGVTGHRSPDPLLHALERFPFDCVLIPLNPAEVHFQSFQENLLPFAAENKIGIIAMKVSAYGRLLRQGGIDSMEQALGYVYTLPVSTAIVGLSSIMQLSENVHIAREFTPYSSVAMENLETLAKPYQEEANFYGSSPFPLVKNS